METVLEKTYQPKPAHKGGSLNSSATKDDTEQSFQILPRRNRQAQCVSQVVLPDVPSLCRGLTHTLPANTERRSNFQTYSLRPVSP